MLGEDDTSTKALYVAAGKKHRRKPDDDVLAQTGAVTSLRNATMGL